jgi:hypothetical protein
MAAAEVAVPNVRRKAPRWPIGFLVVYALCIPSVAILIDHASVAGGLREASWVPALEGLMLLSLAWFGVCVVYLVRYRRLTWWMGIGPALGVLGLVGYGCHVPLQTRFAFGQSALTSAATTYAAQGKQQHNGLDKRIGTYRVGAIDVDAGGFVYFWVGVRGGFVYVPAGRSPGDDPDSHADSYTHLRGRWWAWGYTPED